MTIFLFGISNIGKTTVGEKLAKRLGVVFYDLDEEVKKYYDTTLEEFVNTGTLSERDKKRGLLISEIMKSSVDFKVND
jgi:shikimate kinase